MQNPRFFIGYTKGNQGCKKKNDSFGYYTVNRLNYNYQTDCFSVFKDGEAMTTTINSSNSRYEQSEVIYSFNRTIVLKLV